MPFQVIQTADLLWKDGLPVSKSFDDIYFSKENGLQEVQHVFIEGNDLIRRWEVSLPASSSPKRGLERV